MKGQSSMETMFSIGVMLVFILLLYEFMIYPKIDESNLAQTSSLAVTLCGELSNAINTATYNGNGFSRRITLPVKLSGKSYNTTIYWGTLHLSWAGGDVYCQFKANNISFMGKYPPVTLNKTAFFVNNSNGVVKIA